MATLDEGRNVLYHDPIECYMCGSTQTHHVDYGELKERPAHMQSSSQCEYMHDQCWAEFRALYNPSKERWIVLGPPT